ncbi:MAG: tandem-95 repeat protein, partial [Alcanivoracaceae bacterium]|nr:tandem-95 repeat protein [Alcanivoracaceae bacterium]
DIKSWDLFKNPYIQSINNTPLPTITLEKLIIYLCIANDSDVEGDTLTVVAPGTYTAAGIGGDINISADGSFTYAAPADISGQATFAFDITDGLNIVASSLTINVFAINDAPSFSISGNVDGSSLTPPNTTMNIPDFAANIVLGPSDEQSSQAVLQFNLNVVADSSSVLNSASMANNGQLNLDFTLNSGVATLQISLQDNGGTNDGGVDTSAVIEFTVSYSENSYSIGGTLSGLGAGSVVLQNNGVDDLTLSANGAFVFATPLADLSNYSVAVTTQPNSPAQTCQVTNSAGTLAGQDITNVLVSCNTAPTSIADVYSLAEDGSLNNTDIDGTATATNSDNGVLANDNDVEGDTLTVVAPGTYTAAGIGGDINISADGSFTYTAPADLSGSATLDFEVTDGIHVIASTLTIEVFRINDAPSFSILGDVDATGLISSENNFAQIVGFAFDFIYGPEDEQLTQAVQQFNVNIVSDSNSVLNAASVSNDGTLDLDFTLNNGIAIIQISMRDNGGTSDGGIDTSAILEFTVMNTDMVFNNGFESLDEFRLLDYLDDINLRNQNINTINYDFNEDSIEFYVHSLKLNDDYNSSKIMQRVEFWLTEVLIYEDATGDFDSDGLLNSDDAEPFIFKY